MSTYVVNRQEDCSIARKEASPVNEPHSHTRPRSVRKHKKRRSRQLRPIYHRRMKTKKRRVFLQRFKCYKNTRHGADEGI